MRRLWCIAVVGAACAKPQPPPRVAFVDSPAFTAVQSRAYGVLRGDDEAVVVEKGVDGFAAIFYGRDAEGAWIARCHTGAMRADELDVLRWVTRPGGPLLLMAGSQATPDQVVQNMQLSDLHRGCAPRHVERLLLPVTSDVIGPGSVPAGVTVLEQEGGALVQLTDRPRLVRLEGAEDEVALLMGVRVRQLGGSAELLQIEERDVGFLRAVNLQVAWSVPVPSASPAPPESTQENSTENKATQDNSTENKSTEEKSIDNNIGHAASSAAAPTDQSVAIAEAPAPLVPADPAPSEGLPAASAGDSDLGPSGVEIPGGAEGVLAFRAPQDFIAVEITHGCPGASAVPLSLRAGPHSFVTGERPAFEGFVRAVGRTQRSAEGVWRDLIALRGPQPLLELTLAAHVERRCIRQARGFAFVSPP